jgi:hypothetical protein
MKASNEELLAMMLSGQTQADIARELGMTKQQVCRRVNTPQFQDMLSMHRQKVIDSVFANLTANTKKAADTLVKLLDDKNPFVQYNSACKILSTVQDISLMKDLMKDIADLKEAQQAEQQRY